MLDSTYSQKRIIKNTLFLYLRMFLTMGVGLYTSRVVLKVLGVDDYGLYNVIGGIVVLLSIISNSMTTATQRFITYELGKGNMEHVNRVFSMSMIAHFIICGVILLLGETIGLWYVINQLNIPEGRETAAMWVYQMSLIAVFIRLIQSPYNASIIAYERMSFYAYISIIDVILKLAIVFVLLISPIDKLIQYSILILSVHIFIYFINRHYCNKNFKTCKFHFEIDKAYFKNLFSYLGWNLVGATASLGTQQAGSLIINKYLTVAVNAAYGVSAQVSGAINAFVGNFQVAFTPQLIKLFSQNRMDEFWKLSKTSALLSYFLLFILAFPVCINIDYILDIWLVEVPEYSSVFCQLLILYMLIDAAQAPLWIGINATGNIKVYEIWLSSILLLNIPFSILVLSLGWEPYWVLVVRVLLNFITAVIRCIHVKWQFNFPIKQYFFEVVIHILAVSLVMILIWYVLSKYITYHTFFGLCANVIMYLVLGVVITYILGIGSKEREYLKKFVLNKMFQR